ncbi:endo-1,4-beta-xylanase [Fulvimarina sp. 2208YS6-2-32]|uniref:Beta-xylanase n=1 Tax=Fulvimarina uroteuthidis TaxID=3098149 RepID=A0ABU5HY18_9HYPH|nr:endo-1,4-beta-xylanase [Fulvimarina sp. 2208YS6-2-32]MDY8107945.1 endo-1,4-beta-xylanase [Fulvimarina sp. 2208YS6-2-32]
MTGERDGDLAQSRHNNGLRFGQHRRHALTRRSVLKAGLGAAGALGVSAAGLPAGPAAAQAGKSVAFGGAIQSEYLDSDPDYIGAFLAHCDLVMPMNELKFDLIHPARDEWNFAPADRIVDLALSNGKTSRGTCHVWWGATPSWVERIDTARDAERVLVDHIERVSDRYKGKLTGWDVVNEVLAFDPREDGPLRDTYWLRMLGPRHIPLALRTVARTDPGARLVVNDYDLEFVGDLYDVRRGVMLDLVRQLQDGGVRVDGVGIQGHLYAGRTIDKDAVEAFHRELDRMGIELLVTELDVIDLETFDGPDEMDRIAYGLVDDLLDAVFAWKAPAMVVAWGITDRYTWIPDLMPRSDGTPHRPLPLTRDYEAKDWMALLKRRLAAGA